MNNILSAFQAIFDFLCGDWRIFWGVAITCGLVELIKQYTILTIVIPFSGIIYVSGISLSLILALKREISK